MRVAVVDDERVMTDQIASYLSRFSQENGIEMDAQLYEDPVAFLESYEQDMDLVLLDVEMPCMDGITLAKEIRKIDTHVMLMFITNMAQYALNGYEVEAVDYVIKPIGYQDFAMKMKKVLRYLGREVNRQVLLQTVQGMQPVRIAELLYVEVFRHYLHYHTADAVYEVRGSMKEAEQQLKQYHFARCSQSYLVNLAHVEAIRGNDVICQSQQLPISRNKKAEFIEQFTRYVGGMS